MMTTQKAKRPFFGFFKAVRNDFRKLFITGLLVILPVWITFLTIKFIVGLLDRATLIIPPPWRPENILGFHIPGIGLVLTVVIILFFGFVARNILGRKLVSWTEALIDTIPLVRSVYSAIKKFTNTIFGDSQDFKRAVAIEYPRKGIWTIGFVTNRVQGESLSESLKGEMQSIFVPTTPNPTSGWFLLVPVGDCVQLQISIEDAFKIIVSGGVVLPDSPEFQEKFQSRRNG